MRKILILFLLTLLPKIYSFSQTTSELTSLDSIVCITANDLKYTNLIFVEHKTLLAENSLLWEQLGNYKHENNILSETSLLKTKQITEYEDLNAANLEHIRKLNSELKRKNTAIKCLQIGGIAVTVGLIIAILVR